MTFVTESPARRLRRELGLPPVAARRLHVNTWVGLGCGDQVHRTDDPRHVGRVNQIENSAFVLVQWHDTNWKEWLPLKEVRRVK